MQGQRSSGWSQQAKQICLDQGTFLEHNFFYLQAGLIISGINSEVMPGQWEFQIGPVGPLEVGDQVHLARYLLHRLGEDFGILASFNPKPMKGDWNGELVCDNIQVA